MSWTVIEINEIRVTFGCGADGPNGERCHLEVAHIGSHMDGVVGVAW